MLKILRPFWNTAFLICYDAPVKKGYRNNEFPTNGIDRRHRMHWLSSLRNYFYACDVSDRRNDLSDGGGKSLPQTSKIGNLSWRPPDSAAQFPRRFVPHFASMLIVCTILYHSHQNKWGTNTFHMIPIRSCTLWEEENWDVTQETWIKPK